MGGPSAAQAARPVFATSKDGTRIAAFRSGAGPPLVLVHGTTADHTRWRPVLGALEARFTVYAVDRRGRGASGDTPPYAFEREFEDVAAVVDEAAGAAGARVSLLGHSWGAVCSMGAALRTRHLGRLILYEPPFVRDESVYPSDFLARLDTMIAAGRSDEAVTTFMREVVRVPPAQLELLRSLPAWRGRVAAAHTIAREFRRSGYPIAPESLGGVRVPVLLLEGDRSPPFLREALRLVQSRLAGSRIATMPGQQHAAMDTGPQAFLKPVLEFLA